MTNTTVQRACMTAQAIAAAQPAPRPADHGAALLGARHRMIASGHWSAAQFMGRRWPIGCVALEITQRCNLDCKACYLSENSEAVKDLPLQEVFRRIDMILEHYGPNTGVQVTGGDPTLRKEDELVAIVRRIRQKGMRPTLFTNGIRAKRGLLQRLADAGLVDVAFHVDMMQRHRNFRGESELNALRQQFIERARGLRLAVIFNTTVYDGNFHQIPDVVAFFVRNADVVRLASFQIYADTGRGVLGPRNASINIDSITKQIERGAGASISFDTAQIGHSQCNRYAMCAVVGGGVYDLLDDKSLFADVLEQTKHLQFDRQSRSAAVLTLARGLFGNRALTFKAANWLARKVWQARTDLVRARGRVHKLSFFIHNFMDACSLEQDRIDACVFAAATADGPISMCLHNAKRDAFILQSISLSRRAGDRLWDPLSGAESDQPLQPISGNGTPRTLVKGRAKEALSDLASERRSGDREIM